MFCLQHKVYKTKWGMPPTPHCGAFIGTRRLVAAGSIDVTGDHVFSFRAVSIRCRQPVRPSSMSSNTAQQSKPSVAAKRFRMPPPAGRCGGLLSKANPMLLMPAQDLRPVLHNIPSAAEPMPFWALDRSVDRIALLPQPTARSDCDSLWVCSLGIETCWIGPHGAVGQWFRTF